MKNKKVDLRMYINLACDVLDIPTPYIHYKMPSDLINKVTTTCKKGKYYHIYLNSEYENELLLFNGCIHECRHVYQMLVCDKPEYEILESKETVLNWKNNLENYKNAGTENYELQPLELDAYAFGDYVFNILHGRTVIERTEPLKTTMEKYIKELMKDYPPKLIMKISKAYFD